MPRRHTLPLSPPSSRTYTQSLVLRALRRSRMRNGWLSVGWRGVLRILRIPKAMLQASEPLQMFRAHNSNPDCLIELPDDVSIRAISCVAHLLFRSDPLYVRVHALMRFVHSGGTLAALQCHLDILDLAAQDPAMVLAPALQAVRYLLTLESSNAIATLHCGATQFAVARRRPVGYDNDDNQDSRVTSYVAMVYGGHFVLWCPHCRMYTVVLKGDPQPLAYRSADAVAVLLFAGRGGGMTAIWNVGCARGYDHVAHELWMATATSVAQDRLRRCCLVRGDPFVTLTASGASSVEVPRRLLDASPMFCGAAAIVRLANADHLDGLLWALGVLKRDPFGLQLNKSPRSMAISPGMAIVINKGLCDRIQYLLRRYGFRSQSLWARFDGVLRSKRACSDVMRRLVDERPSLETMHAGTSRNPIMGNILVRWNLNLNWGGGGGVGLLLRYGPMVLA